MQTTGFLLAVIGVLKQSYEVVMWALNLPNRMKQKADVGFAQQAEPAQRRVAREATMFSPCWKLPYCREVIRKQCPAFLAGKTCWKFGRGCYCDEGKQQKEDDVHGYFVVRATSRPVISKLIIATGKRNTHANFINWS